MIRPIRPIGQVRKITKGAHQYQLETGPNLTPPQQKVMMYPINQQVKKVMLLEDNEMRVCNKVSVG